MLNSLNQNYISIGSAVHSPNGVVASPNLDKPITAAMFRPTYITAIALTDDTNRRLGTLSPRQREVARLAATGLSNKQIGRELGITEGTVKAHMKEAMKALGAERRYELPSLLMADRPTPGRKRVQLTQRQNEVLALVADGLRSEEIAVRLGVVAGTVKQHMTAILRALNVSNRTSAVAWWLQHGNGRLKLSMRAASAEG